MQALSSINILQFDDLETLMGHVYVSAQALIVQPFLFSLDIKGLQEPTSMLRS